MPVSPVRVEGHDHLGPHLLDQGAEFDLHIEGRDVHQRERVVVSGALVTPRVVVVEEDRFRNLQRPARLAQFPLALLAEVVHRHARHGDLSGLAPGRAGEKYPHAPPRVVGEGAADAERLVVGVGEHREEGGLL